MHKQQEHMHIWAEEQTKIKTHQRHFLCTLITPKEDGKFKSSGGHKQA